jgi:hypothetical protein
MCFKSHICYTGMCISSILLDITTVSRPSFPSIQQRRKRDLKRPNIQIKEPAESARESVPTNLAQKVATNTGLDSCLDHGHILPLITSPSKHVRLPFRVYELYRRLGPKSLPLEGMKSPRNRRKVEPWSVGFCGEGQDVI